jgi:hypothetical protein
MFFPGTIQAFFPYDTDICFEAPRDGLGLV